MDKQAQDERWQALTEDGRQARIASYKELLKLQKEEADSYLITIEDLEKLYGTHNLNPEPQIKTWEDVEEYYKNEVSTTETFHIYFAYGIEKGIDDKCFAMLKIAKLIELGYGGMVSEEEWKDESLQKWCVIVDYKDPTKLANYMTDCYYQFIAFHTPEQREEFMSHESNRQLVKQYYLM